MKPLFRIGLATLTAGGGLLLLGELSRTGLLRNRMVFLVVALPLFLVFLWAMGRSVDGGGDDPR